MSDLIYADESTVFMVIFMNLKTVRKMTQALWKTGLPEEAAEYLYEKANAMLLEEETDKESFQQMLEHLSNDELMAYVPDIYQENIYRIDYDRLKEKGIKLISFDIDDTITGLEDFKTSTDARNFFESLRNRGFLVALLSNTWDAKAKKFAGELGGVEYIANAEKPLPNAFLSLLSKHGLDKNQMLHVGNNISSDVYGGNSTGILTALVRRAGWLSNIPKWVLPDEKKHRVAVDELEKRRLWYRHHRKYKDDQYYQLGEAPAYRREGASAQASAQGSPAVTVFCDGKAPYEAASNLCGYIRSIGIDAALKDADDFYEGYPGKVIIIGHHDLTKRQLAAADILNDSYGMMFGHAQDRYVLRASRSALGKGKKGRVKFEEYYNTEIRSYIELAEKYNVPLRFGSRDKTRKSQYDLMWLVFAAHWLRGFLEGTDECKQEAGVDIAQRAANDLIQKVYADKDTVYTLDELFQNIYKANEDAGLKTLRRHLGDDIAFTGLWADAKDERELEESELLEGELSGRVFSIGGYTVRSAVCLYRDDDEVDYTQRVPASREAAAQYLEDGWQMLGAVDGVRKVESISARYSGFGSEEWRHVCLAAASLRWYESISFIGTLRPSASAPAEQESLFVLKQYTGDSFGVANWYKLSSDGSVTEYEEHPYNPESYEESWKDAEQS